MIEMITMKTIYVGYKKHGWDDREGEYNGEYFVHK